MCVQKTWSRWDVHTVLNEVYLLHGNTTGHWEGESHNYATAQVSLTSLRLGRRNQSKRHTKWSPFYILFFYSPKPDSISVGCGLDSGHPWEMCGVCRNGVLWCGCQLQKFCLICESVPSYTSKICTLFCLYYTSVKKKKAFLKFSKAIQSGNQKIVSVDTPLQTMKLTTFPNVPISLNILLKEHIFLIHKNMHSI